MAEDEGKYTKLADVLKKELQEILKAKSGIVVPPWLADPGPPAQQGASDQPNAAPPDRRGPPQPTPQSASDEPSPRPPAPQGPSERTIFAYLGEEDGPNLSALCLSGGGIRSATFNLGVIQRLARLGMLSEFDYLSSVSGGGYIASWLRTWMFRVGSENVLKELKAPPKKPTPQPLLPKAAKLSAPETPPKPEPKELPKAEPEAIQNLRAYSNYLTPKLGLLSGDTWAAAAIVLRNLLLNWLVLVPLIAAVIAVPQLLLLMARGMTYFMTDEKWHLSGQVLLYLSLALELGAAYSVYWHRRFLQMPDEETAPSQARYIIGCVLPVCLAAGVLCTAVLLLDMDPKLKPPLWQLWGFALLWSVVVPSAGWVLVEIKAARRPRSEEKAEEQSATGVRQPDHQKKKMHSRGYEAGALVVSGIVGAALLVAVTNGWYKDAIEKPIFYVVFALPVLLGIYLIARALFVSFASLSEGLFNKVSASDDNDREWWARLSGWVLLVLASWTVVTAICLFGRHIPEYISSLPVTGDGKEPMPVKLVHLAITALGGVSGIAAALLSSSDTTVNDAQHGGGPSTARKIIQWTAAPLFLICLLILLTWSTAAFGEWLISFWESTPTALFSIDADFHPREKVLRDVTPLDVGIFAAMLFLLAGISWGAGAFVNVNRFSLHGMYRNRLVRAYLGASNPDRRPDPFTGFSWRDNPKLWELWRVPCATPGAPGNGVPEATRPLPIINTTLNLVQGKNLAWQQRKAASFSMTPFHCGNFRLGYRPSRFYGGPNGISVGSAVTISGAAVSPNMGYNSSPVLAFLMTLFNVRLGAWLGNTNENGEKTYRCAGPRQALVPILSELLGMTDDDHSYVNLSDGGHFDNLGLYEVVLRRCRYIVVSDAGRDPGEKATFAFEDLGNAIRKIRIDFGIRIEFQHRIRIRPKDSTEPGLYCALARVRYSEMDGTPEETDGWVVYLKPTLPGDDEQLPYDVYSYARSSKDFPHESTSDQWFSESQFESYRALGFHAIDSIVSRQPSPGCLADFIQSVEGYLNTTPNATPSAATRRNQAARAVMALAKRISRLSRD